MNIFYQRLNILNIVDIKVPLKTKMCIGGLFMCAKKKKYVWISL